MADTNQQTKPAAAPAAGATAAAAPAPAKAPAKPKAEPKPPRFDPKGTITLLADKEGKKYGPDNNPKRAGTKSETWFSNYRDGMTIADLQAAFTKTGGSMNSNLDWDIKHEYVKYNPPKA